MDRSFAEIVGGAARPVVRSKRHARRRRRRILVRILVPLLVLVVVLGVAGYGASLAFPDQFRTLMGYRDDWTGTGSGTTEITVQNGDVGADVASELAAGGVVKTSKAFYDLLLKTRPEPTFDAGTYRLAKHQSAASALQQLQAPGSLVVATVAIPEGSTVAQILAIAAKATGTPVAELRSAAADYRALGVPASAPSLEGYLFPATYRFPPRTSATSMLTTMVDRMFQALDAEGVPSADREKTLTLAGLVQKEGNGSDDAKVARVFLNRIAQKMPLQSDASVSYGAHGTTVVPTQAQYANRNGYNTYLRTGLPKGPISNPGDVAIRAALHPAPGSWLFFVTVNLASGETVFSTTEAQHEKAAAQFQAWLKAHPSYSK